MPHHLRKDQWSPHGQQCYQTPKSINQSAKIIISTQQALLNPSTTAQVTANPTIAIKNFEYSQDQEPGRDVYPSTRDAQAGCSHA